MDHDELIIGVRMTLRLAKPMHIGLNRSGRHKYSSKSTGVEVVISDEEYSGVEARCIWLWSSALCDTATASRSGP